MLLGGAVLMGGPGCICINNQVGIPPGGSYATKPTGSAPPSGGNFAAVTAALTGTTDPNTICGQNVTKKRANFYPPSIPGPTAGETHFQGWLVNVSTGAIIPNSHYVLQWIININNKGCANPVSGSTTDVRFAAQSGVYYQIAAHFKPGFVPPGNPTIELRGSWIVL